MESEQIKQEIDAIQNRLNELRQIVKSPQKARKMTVCDLKEGDEYWVISFLYSEPHKYKWSNSEIEINMRAMGLIFLTKEECQKAIDVMKAKTLWKKTITELNDGREPDWNDRNKYKYYYFLDHRTNNLKLDCEIQLQTHRSDIYANSLEILEKARKLLGDEITRLAWIGE